MPFPVYFLAAGLLTGVIGALVGFPALRLQGIYLVIATISFAFIVEEILARWESVTNGNEGMRVKTIQLLGTSVPRDSPAFYFLCLGVLVLTIVGTLNLLRSPTGRAFVAIRDSETAARSMGVNVSLYKVKSFAISAAITGFAGCLFAHKLSFISPEMFTLQLSIEFIIVILIGGAFSLHGAVLGAIFIVMIDPFLTYLKDDLPGMVAGVAAALGAGAERAARIQGNVAAFASANGLKGAIYGVIIVLFVLFEPLGLYGRWLKIKLFFQLFAVKDKFAILELDFIMVKGKKEPEVIYAIAGREDTAQSGRFQRLRNLTIEMLACYRSRDWQGALEAIERGRKTDEANALKLLYNLYEARIRDYQKNPPPEDWNGAFALLTK